MVVASGDTSGIVGMEHRGVKWNTGEWVNEMMPGSLEPMKATSAGVCSDKSTRVREQALPSVAALLPTKGRRAPLQSGGNVVQWPESGKKSECRKDDTASQVSSGHGGLRTGQLRSCCAFLVWFV